jgi:hypothetical protein
MNLLRKAQGARPAPKRAGGPARRLRPNKFGLAWVNSKKLTQCVAAAAGPKRREALATGARHRKLGAGFYTFLIFKKTRRLASFSKTEV